MPHHRACAILLTRRGGRLGVLAFDHPLAGTQLPKGRIDRGEPIPRAAARELREETGLIARPLRRLQTIPHADRGATWHLVLLTGPLPRRHRWAHVCADDGGHLFGVRSIPLTARPTAMHACFRKVLSRLRHAPGLSIPLRRP